MAKRGNCSVRRRRGSGHDGPSLLPMPEWITTREAAAILGVHPSAVPKMIRRGDLKKRQKRPVLHRAQVEVLRDERARPKVPPEPPRQPQPPDAEHDWLTAHEAGALMGVTSTAVSQRARRGRLPSEVHDGRRWFRRDHLELVKRADEVKRDSSALGRPNSLARNRPKG